MTVLAIPRFEPHGGCSSALVFGLIAAFSCLAPQAAKAALSCIASAADVNFSDVVPWESSGSLTGAIVVTCRTTGWLDASQNVNVCLSIGTGQNNSDWNTRRLFLDGSTSTSMGFQIYKPDGTLFGSAFQATPRQPYMISNMSVPGGGGSSQQTVNMRVTLPAQPTVTPRGNYTGNFQGGHTMLTYTSSRFGTPSDCTNLQSSNDSFPFNVTANVTDYCAISAIAPMSFPDVAGFGDTERLASTSVGLRCTLNTAYRINLTPSNNNGNGQGALKRTAGGTDTVPYMLYSNDARSTPWGNQASNNVSGTGTGLPGSVTVYGRVPANLDATPGNYNDTVQVTVTY